MPGSCGKSVSKSCSHLSTNEEIIRWRAHQNNITGCRTNSQYANISYLSTRNISCFNYFILDILNNTPEDWGSMFLRNVVPTYKSTRRHNPEYHHRKFRKFFQCKFLCHLQASLWLSGHKQRVLHSQLLKRDKVWIIGRYNCALKTLRVVKYGIWIF
jgi:hypothetical protein